MTDGADRDWQALGREVRKRREAMGLRQSDLPGRNGPSLGTVQNIEQGARDRYAPRSLRQLERALSTSEGWVDRMLAGTATADDLDPNVRFGAVEANLGGPQDQARADDSVVRGGDTGRGTEQGSVTRTVCVTSRDQEDILRGLGYNVAVGDTLTVRGAEQVTDETAVQGAVDAVASALKQIRLVSTPIPELDSARSSLRDAFNALLDGDAAIRTGHPRE